MAKSWSSRIVAVGQHDDGGVLHRGIAHEAAGIERHRQALARPLRVPDDADAAVARRTARLPPGRVAVGPLAWRVHVPLHPSRAQRLGDRGLHRVELVVARHLLGERAAAVVLEHDEVPDQGQQPGRRADALDQDLQLRQRRVGERLARDRPPRLEPLPLGSQRADARLESVRHDQRRVEHEQRGNLHLVGLKLLERRPDRRVLVGRVLQLDDAQRQPVDEQHDVRPAFVLVLDDRELVHREPVVGLRFVEVEYADLVATNPAVSVGVLHRDAGDEHSMEVAVAGLQRRPRRAGHSAHRVVERVVGQVGVEAGERGPQAAVQDNLAVVGAFRDRRVGRDVGAVQDGPAK